MVFNGKSLVVMAMAICMHAMSYNDTVDSCPDPLKTNASITMQQDQPAVGLNEENESSIVVPPGDLKDENSGESEPEIRVISPDEIEGNEQSYSSTESANEQELQDATKAADVNLSDIFGSDAEHHSTTVRRKTRILKSDTRNKEGLVDIVKNLGNSAEEIEEAESAFNALFYDKSKLKKREKILLEKTAILEKKSDNEKDLKKDLFKVPIDQNRDNNSNKNCSNKEELKKQTEENLARLNARYGNKHDERIARLENKVSQVEHMKELLNNMSNATKKNIILSCVTILGVFSLVLYQGQQIFLHKMPTVLKKIRQWRMKNDDAQSVPGSFDGSLPQSTQ